MIDNPTNELLKEMLRSIFSWQSSLAILAFFAVLFFFSENTFFKGLLAFLAAVLFISVFILPKL